MAKNGRSLLAKSLYLEVQKNRCIYCGHLIDGTRPEIMAIELKKTPRAATWEHVVPLGKGGYNTLCNLVLVCQPCNNARRDLMPTDEEYLMCSRIIWNVFVRLVGFAPKSTRQRARMRGALRMVPSGPGWNGFSANPQQDKELSA